MMNDVNLEKLLQKQLRLNSRIKTVKTRNAYQERKNETRRKILVGAYILDKHRKEKTIYQLHKELDWFLTRSNDRILFGLHAKEEIEQEAKEQQEDVNW